MFDAESLDFSQGVPVISGYEAPQFLCFGCGVCCRKYYIRISLNEALGIAARLDVGWDAWLSNYTDPVHSGTEYFVLRRTHGACVFLRHDRKMNVAICTIHAFKPSVCREWVASLNQPDCREGLLKLWGLTLTPAGKIQGEPGKVREFFAHLKAFTY